MRYSCMYMCIYMYMNMHIHMYIVYTVYMYTHMCIHLYMHPIEALLGVVSGTYSDIERVPKALCLLNVRLLILF